MSQTIRLSGGITGEVAVREGGRQLGVLDVALHLRNLILEYFPQSAGKLALESLVLLAALLPGRAGLTSFPRGPVRP